MFELKDLKNRLIDSPIKVRLLYLASLCEHGLKDIEKYFSVSDRRTYHDSVIGLLHTVDPSLPNRALSLIKNSLGNPSTDSLNKIRGEYSEPIVALQDGDLEIDNELVLFYYYAIYNLILYALNPEDEKQMMLIVRQAISSYMLKFDGSPEQEEEIKKIFYKWWKNTEK